MIASRNFDTKFYHSAVTQKNLKALTRGRTDNFSSILADREFSAGCYIFAAFTSDMLLRHGSETGFPNFTFTFK